MRKDLLPLHLRNLVIRGFEDDPKKEKKDDDPDKKTGKESDDDSEDDDDDDDDDDDKGKEKKEPENNDGLKSALAKERKAAKDANRALKAAQKRLDEIDSKDKSDSDKAKDDASKAESKATKLAVRLKDTAVDNVIIRLGGKQKFRDIDDALKLIDRSAIEVDQDEDDPSEVDIDEDSVKSALEKLAKAKPHLILAEGQEDKSGSKFNGKKKSDKDADEETLRTKYTALNRSGVKTT